MSDLSSLLHEAVADVEPADRLVAVRARARQRRTRRLWVVSGGAVVAAAATVAAVVLATHPGTSAGPEPGPATHVPTATEPTTAPSASERHAVAIYYLGGSTSQPKLYREFRAYPESVPTPSDALDGLVSGPSDPDYRTLWPSGAFAWVKVGQDLITVSLSDASLRERPVTMSEAEAAASVQQVVYTLQAYAQQRLAVQFTYNGNPIDQVLGVPTSEPLANAPILQTLSRVNLTTPSEGEELSGTLDVEGVANSYEANVTWSLEDQSQVPVDSGSFTATGYMAEKLFPFHGSIDVSSLDPGTYTLIVSTDDPSGAGNVDNDSRTVIIR